MTDAGGFSGLYGVPPGADFPRAVIDGLLRRFAGAPPEALARVKLYVNTRRMQRRMSDMLVDGGARLLPRIRLVTDIGAGAILPGLQPPAPPLRRRLQLTRLVARLIARQPDLAPRSAAFDLAVSLAQLLDEMQGEGVTPEDLRRLDVSDQSGHWQRSLQFVDLVGQFVTASASDSPDPEARQRLAVIALTEQWARQPPDGPVIVAGSTGSRGTTALLMSAVARLDRGAVILPGFDFDMTGEAWAALDDPASGEDHPQFRFARLCRLLGVEPDAMRRWHAPAAAPDPDRNRTVSLVMRPAPVTDCWLREGPALPDPRGAMQNVTLIEAPGQRDEAAAIALVMRNAVETGDSVALITPDRVLTRQVTAALDRWDLVPDDSAGRPLHLTPPGRFLRLTAALIGRTLTAEALLALLKHPLTASGDTGGSAHRLHSRELELYLRRAGVPFPTADDIRAFAAQDGRRQGWAEWLSDLIDGLDRVGARPLAEQVAEHLRLSVALTAGPGKTGGAGALWDKDAGIEARAQMQALQREADHGAAMLPHEYDALIDTILGGVEVREPLTAHPGLMIWGTLEARVQGADLVIAAGLNEGVWPETPGADPWLNRRMRLDAGLLLPERRVGLAAHDFQQALGASRVILTRAVRDAEAETVPSRWLNRLTNYLGGVSDVGKAALEQMRDRGALWLELARRLDAPDAPQPPAPRPAPRPPLANRPGRLSITEIQTLIRDPYAIYARHVLGLRPLQPLRAKPEAAARGTVIHRVMERWVGEIAGGAVPAKQRLLDIAREEMAAAVPWPLARRMWLARVEAIADWIVAEEVERLAGASPVALEQRGEMRLAAVETLLVGKIDRIDRAADGTYHVYDYKTGTPPNKNQMVHFDKQLILSALMLSNGGVGELPAGTVSKMSYIGLSREPRLQEHAVTAEQVASARSELEQLLGAYRDERRGYAARRAPFREDQPGDYDHLARFGEWDGRAPPEPTDVGR